MFHQHCFFHDEILQIVIDITRHILYTQFEKGTIEVFDLGSKGTSTSKILSMTRQNTTHYATNIARTIDRSNFTSIVHISAIENRESTPINLTVITHTGVRLYFTTSMTPKPLATTRPDCLFDFRLDLRLTLRYSDRIKCRLKIVIRCGCFLRIPFRFISS